MKKSWTIYFLLVISGINAQVADSIKYTEEFGMFESQEIFSDYDYVFLTKEPTRYLWKINYPNLNFRNSFFRFQMGYERKIGKAFSWNTEIGITTLDRRYSIDYHSVGIILEPRWYYRMKKQMEKGESANNLSGLYIGLEIQKEYEEVFSKNRSSGPYRTTLKYGLQKRFSKRAYVDMSIGAGVLFATRNYNSSFYLQPSIKLGYAFGEKTNINFKDRQCAVFKCHEEGSQLFKFNLLDFLDFQYVSNRQGSSLREWILRPNISYERKLGDSPFSIAYNGELIFGRFNYVINDESVKGERFGYNLGIESRYYYNQKKKIASGEAANNLSSNYLFLRGSYYNSEYGSDEGVITYLGWGAQRRIFDFGYLDFQAGLLADPNYFSGSVLPLQPYLSLKIGFAFE